MTNLKYVALSLGSSLGDRRKYINEAIQNIENKIGKVIKTSSVYETEPWGFTDENMFLNQVITINTILSPQDTLKEINVIEQKLGRIRKNNQYQARTIDIDILYYDNLIMNTVELQIPHKYLHKRKFVLEPLCEIEPQMINPILNIDTQKMLDNFNLYNNILQ